MSAGIQPIAAAEAQIPTAADPAIDRRTTWRAVVNAGTVAGVLCLVPGLAIFALPLAGLICVLLHRRATMAKELTPGAGFRLGAKAGIVGFVILALVRILSTFAMHAQDTVRTSAIEAVQRTGSFYNDQEIKEAVEVLKTPGGLAFSLIVGALIVSAIFAILCGIGGAVSAALLRRKLPPH
jgi:hypothetical protein